MKKNHAILALSLTLSLAASCAETSSKSAPPTGLPADPELDLGDPNLAVRAPIAEGNLVFWPVVPKSAVGHVETAPAYLALDQALGSGAAEVLETQDVNEIEIVNHSDKPLLLLAGEVVAGGQQDRIVGRDLVIAPGAKAPLASFCVEHGRWQAEQGDASGGTKFSAGAALAAAPVRYAAQVNKDQSLVWASVGYLAAANDSGSPTGKYMAVVNNEAVHKSVEERAAAMLGTLAGSKDAVGFVVAVDWGQEDELVAAEVFGGPELFGAFREKLVRAYCLDAVTREKSTEIAAAMELSPAHGVGGGGNAQQLAVSYAGPSTPGASSLSSLDFAASAPDPDLVVDAERVEAGNVEFKHLHRTIYKQKQK
jgi:ARG/rhodanese/phosphatase superfamily protein